MTSHPDTEADDVKRLAIILASADLLIDLLDAGELQAVATLIEQILDHPGAAVGYVMQWTTPGAAVFMSTAPQGTGAVNRAGFRP